MGISMYKILLVDDEELVVKSLRATLNWKEFGFEIAGCAYSAKEALAQIEELKPDVVITDIKMPKINGLELLQMIKAEYPGIHCLVISGYAEFAYIQKSIRLEAEGYCLKPFDAGEISVYLKRIKKRLDESVEDRGRCNCLSDYIQSTSEEALNYMQGYYKKKEIDFNSMQVHALYILGTDRLELMGSLLTLNAGFQKIICLVRQEELEDFTKRITDTFQNSVHVGISKVIAAYDKTAKAIREARSSAYQYFCEQDCPPVIRYREIAKDKSLLQALERELEHKDYNKIRRYILEISEKFMNGEYNMDFAIYLQNIYASWISNQNKDSDKELIYEYDILCELYPDVFELLQQMETDFNEMNQKTSFQNQISNKTFMTIFRYLECNYLKQINITQLSEEFHINASYFSQLFKKEMGCTFTDYLAKKRIEYAGKLLLETDLKINEIAEISGFSDYFYFSRVFRKIKNCSPTEYRTK